MNPRAQPLLFAPESGASPSDGTIICYMHCFIISLPDVMFGFERPMYPVMEGDEVEVCVVLQSPASLGKTVTLQVTSEDISAEGYWKIVVSVTIKFSFY